MCKSCPCSKCFDKNGEGVVHVGEGGRCFRGWKAGKKNSPRGIARRQLGAGPGQPWPSCCLHYLEHLFQHALGAFLYEASQTPKARPVLESHDSIVRLILSYHNPPKWEAVLFSPEVKDWQHLDKVYPIHLAHFRDERQEAEGRKANTWRNKKK